MKYKVVFTEYALNDIKRLDMSVAERVVNKLNWLAKNYEKIIPQPLKSKFQGLYKLVVGDWRVIYEADFVKKVITVHLIGHRREIYRRRRGK